MKKIPKPLHKLPEDVAIKKAKALADGERTVYTLKEIHTWTGLSKGERQLLIGIRTHMRERTSMKGSKGWVSATIKQIAKYATFEERQARRLIDSLDSKKVLEIAGSKKGPGSKRGYAINKRSCCFAKTSSDQTPDAKLEAPNSADAEQLKALFSPSEEEK
jgi:hypothetical protein